MTTRLWIIHALRRSRAGKGTLAREWERPVAGGARSTGWLGYVQPTYNVLSVRRCDIINNDLTDGMGHLSIVCLMLACS